MQPGLVEAGGSQGVGGWWGAAVTLPTLCDTAASPPLPGAGPAPLRDAEPPVSLGDRWECVTIGFNHPQQPSTPPGMCRGGGWRVGSPIHAVAEPPILGILGWAVADAPALPLHAFVGAVGSPGDLTTPEATMGCGVLVGAVPLPRTHHLPASALLSLLTFSARSSSSSRRFSSSTARSAASRPCAPALGGSAGTASAASVPPCGARGPAGGRAWGSLWGLPIPLPLHSPVGPFSSAVASTWSCRSCSRMSGSCPPARR